MGRTGGGADDGFGDLLGGAAPAAAAEPAVAAAPALAPAAAADRYASLGAAAEVTLAAYRSVRVPGPGVALTVALGLGRLAALYHRSSTVYQIHEHVRRLCF